MLSDHGWDYNMAFTEGGTEGLITGVIETIIVNAPPAGTRRMIKTINIYTVEIALLSVIVKNGIVDSVIWSGWLDPGDTWVFGSIGEIIVLDSINKYVIAKLDAPPVIQPTFKTSYGDAS